MLRYSKIILRKVSFDPTLLNKEYEKCLTYLDPTEKIKLNIWISRQQFAFKIHPKVDNNLSRN